MAEIEQVVAAERRKQRAIWLVCVAAMLMVGAIQRDRRALLLGEAIQPSAFAAIVPSAQPAAAAIALATRPEYGVGSRRARRPVSGGGGAQAFFSAPQRNLPTGAGGAGGGGTAADSNGPGAGLAANTPTAGAGAGAGGGSSAGGGGGGGGVLQAPGTGPVGGGGGVGPVGAVPEPATWMMMILGFGGIGCLLRRRRDRAYRDETIGFAHSA